MTVSQTQIDLATDVLEEYAADDVSGLAELLFDAEPKQFVALFDEFAAHGDAAISKLSGELDRTLTYQWNDDPLDAEWSEPSDEVERKIELADGMMVEQFAFCQTMPLDEFQSVAEQLRESGFRPIRLRPYAHKDSVQVAAAWTRDGRDWRITIGESPESITQQDERQRGEGFCRRRCGRLPKQS